MFRKAAFLFLLSFAPAFADIVFTVTPSELSTPPGGIPNVDCQSVSGSCLIFTGTIVDTDDPLADPVFFNAIQVAFPNLAGPADPIATANLILNPNFTLNPLLGPPGTFFGGDSYPINPPGTGGIFEIDVNPNTPLGIYPGTVYFYGGADMSAMNLLGQQGFQIDVTPEPATLPIAIAALGGLVWFRRRR